MYWRKCCSFMLGLTLLAAASGASAVTMTPATLELTNHLSVVTVELDSVALTSKGNYAYTFGVTGLSAEAPLQSLTFSGYEPPVLTGHVSVTEDLDTLWIFGVSGGIGANAFHVTFGTSGGPWNFQVEAVFNAHPPEMVIALYDPQFGLVWDTVTFDASGGSVGGASGPSVPEPSAALVFAAGMLITRRLLRRWR